MEQRKYPIGDKGMSIIVVLTTFAQDVADLKRRTAND